MFVRPIVASLPGARCGLLKFLALVHGALVYPDHWLYAFGKTEERPPLARVALAIYSLLFYLLTPLILLRLLWRGQKAPEYRQRWAERFG